MLDTLGMFDAAFGLPEQLEAAAAGAWEASDLPPAGGLTSVAILGMGGSGIGGDVAAAVAGPSCPVPLTVSKHYECPGYVGPDTLVLALSFSGNTEETVAATTEAHGRGARGGVRAAGGHHERLAHEWGAPTIPVDASIPMPRAALGAMTAPLLVVLERLGLYDAAEAEIGRAAEQLRRRRDRLGADGNDAQALARRIGRTLPLVYGGGALGEAAAWRWKGQFNENPKVPSWCNRVPELTHNELCGWGQHGDVTRQVFTLLFLRHAFEHPQVARRFEFIAAACDEVVSDIHTVTAEGDGPLAQFLDLVMVGDLVTLHMAVDAGVDPGPVAVLDEIKAFMAS
jgi:glucose/mannose-6-phosphate isomerase